MEKLKEILIYLNRVGFPAPAIYDADKKGPSVSLLFAYIAYLLTIIGISTLMYKNLETGVLAGIIYSVLMIVFYLMRRLTKAKFDLDDKSIDLESDNFETIKKEEK